MSVSGGADEEAADDGSEGAAVVNCGPSLAGGCVGVSGLVLDIVAAAERATRSRMPSSSAGFRTMSRELASCRAFCKMQSEITCLMSSWLLAASELSELAASATASPPPPFSLSHSDHSHGTRSEPLGCSTSSPHFTSVPDILNLSPHFHAPPFSAKTARTPHTTHPLLKYSEYYTHSEPLRNLFLLRLLTLP